MAKSLSWLAPQYCLGAGTLNYTGNAGDRVDMYNAANTIILYTNNTFAGNTCVINSISVGTYNIHVIKGTISSPTVQLYVNGIGIQNAPSNNIVFSHDITILQPNIDVLAAY